MGRQTLDFQRNRYVDSMVRKLERYELSLHVEEDLNHLLDAIEDHAKGCISAQWYQEKTRRLQNSLQLLFNSLRLDLKVLAGVETPFDPHFCHVPGFPHLRSEVESEILYTKDRFFWAVFHLSHFDGKGWFPCDSLPGCISEALGRMGKKKREAFDDELYKYLEHLNAVAETLSALQYWSPSLPDADQPLEHICEREDHEQWGLRSDATLQLMSKWLPSFQRPLANLLELPPARSRSGPPVRSAEADEMLNAFWGDIRHIKNTVLKRSERSEQDRHDYLAQVFGVPIGEQDDENTRSTSPSSDADSESESASISLSEGVEDREDAEHPAADSAILNFPDGTEQSDVLSTEKEVEAGPNEQVGQQSPAALASWSSPGTHEERPLVIRKIKERIKTRPATAPAQPIDLAPVEQQPAQAEQHIKVFVNAESLELFHRMYTPAATHKKTACVSWDDLVGAFADAGCTSRQKSGSAVNFTCGPRGTGMVSIHRPHPDPTINPIKLKEIAKKLEKYFGWTKESFVERERAANAP